MKTHKALLPLVLITLSAAPAAFASSNDVGEVEDAVSYQQIDPVRDAAEMPVVVANQEEIRVQKDPQAKIESRADFSKVAIWSKLRGSAEWTQAVRRVVRAHFREFDRARDVDKFCPGYSKLPASETGKREACWIRLISAVSYFESSFNPSAGFMEANGHPSIGMLSLSPGECANAISSHALRNPVENLVCGTQKMADLIDRDGWITGPGHRGAATYWSVLRAPYRQRRMHLGKRDQIVRMTRNYQEVAPVMTAENEPGDGQ